ncbi:MAG: amidohydrolase family protein [Gemmatimonadales bacterium]
MRILAIVALLVCLATASAALKPAAAQDTTIVVVDTTTKYKSDSLPLVPERRLSFETDEGTWLSLDISPDGRTLVFELLGDLYTLPISGGEAKRITSGLPFDSQPRYSPDGKRIVFLSDRDGSENVWTCAADGTLLKQVTRGATGLFASPTWTPDGDYVIVSRQEDPLKATYQLWLYHRDGGTGISLTKPDSGANAVGTGRRPGIDAMGAAFGSDPRYIWFARHKGGFGYNLTFPQWQLATYDRETGKVVVQSDIYGSSMRPVLSPDGKWLVYATRHDGETGLRLRDLVTGGERWLRYPVQRDDQESRFTRDLMPGSAFTPDGKALITSYAGKIWRVEVPGGAATQIPFRARVDQEAGPLVRFSYPVDTGLIVVHQIRNPASSPDGKRLAFSALDRLYVMDWPSGAPRRLTRDSVHEQVPAWSPDGKWIAYVSWGDSGGSVSRVRADGKGKPERLNPSLGFFDQTAWAPDGKRIVVVREPVDLRLRERDPAGYELAWLPATGGKLTRIAFIAPGGRPHFTQDTSRVYIYDPNDGLVSMRWDGTDRRVHLKVTGYKPPVEEADPEPAEEARVSPDGRRAVAQVGNRIYLVSLPRVGGQVPEVNVALPKEAAFPIKRLTRVGGDFASWSRDGRFIEWSIGRSYFRYDPVVGDSLDRLKTSADSARADSLEKAVAAGAQPDSAAKARADSIARLPAYEGQRLDITIRVLRDVPRGTVVLRGARIITMKGNQVIPEGDVVVRDNRIVYVGPTRTGPPGSDATVIEVAGKTIIPGLVDIHSHMWPTWGVHETQVWKYLINLAYGVTTTRDPQTSTTDILTYADQVETGELLGPRIYSTGPGVFWDENFQDLDEAREALRRYSEFYHTNTIKQYLTGNRKQRQWVIMAAKELGLMPTIEGGLDFKMNLTAMIDGYPGHEHSYPIMPLARDAVELAARSGITYTPTLLVNYGGPLAENYFYQRYDIHENPKVKRFMPHEEIDIRAERGPWFRENQYVFPRIAAGAAAIVKAGGRVGLGGHSQMDGLGSHWELWALASGGMSPLEVLRVGTIFGAEAIGLDGDLGSLEPGKLADLIVLDKNPLDDIKHTEAIRMVMKNGRLYDGDDLTERWPRQRALPPLWWSSWVPRAGK